VNYRYVEFVKSERWRIPSISPDTALALLQSIAQDHRDLRLKIPHKQKYDSLEFRFQFSDGGGSSSVVIGTIEIHDDEIVLCLHPPHLVRFALAMIAMQLAFPGLLMWAMGGFNLGLSILMLAIACAWVGWVWWQYQRFQEAVALVDRAIADDDKLL
jgi:hypothetical protein